jgi:hypothetical protein
LQNQAVAQRLPQRVNQNQFARQSLVENLGRALAANPQVRTIQAMHH